MHRPLNPLDHPICLSRPKRLSVASAWNEHVPFAMLLVDLVRPRVLVELGAHAGVSYCSFCQAVSELGLDTQCHAIDSWKGDAQAGFYGPEVLAELRAHHDPLYGSFSRLTQATFDEALKYFGDGSIDLLHIDGFHSYEAVRADFEQWLPKMSRKGVMVFHDINVRENGFGVWKVWEELSARYPHFAFDHGHGLGVLAVGDQPPEALQSLLEARGEEAARIKAFFFELGTRLLQRLAHEGTEAERARLAREVAELTARHAEERGRAEALQAALQGAELRAARAEAAARVREADLARGKEQGEAALGALRAELERLRTEVKLKANHISNLEAIIAGLRESLASINGSLAFKLVNRYWALRERVLPPGTRRGRLYQKGKRTLQTVARRGADRHTHGAQPPQEPSLAPASASADAQAESGSEYERWLQQNALKPEDVERLRARARALEYQPLISVVTPVYNVEERWLRKAIESVLAQVYTNWELVLVDDKSTQEHIAPVLREYAARDSRIKVIFQERNGGIAASSAEGVERATGEFVALLDHDDELTPDALYEVARRLNDDPALDFLYSDEDKLDLNGRRLEPFFKPDWSPDLLLSMNYICHLSVIRRDVLLKAGSFRPGFDGSQDYDLFLRVSEQTDRIAHIPKILYHWRKIPNSTAETADAKPYAHEAAKRALEAALERRSRPGSVTMLLNGLFRVRYKVEGTPRVSIIIPTKDRVDMLSRCVDSILAKSSYPNIEVLIVDNNSTEPEMQRYLDTLPAPHRVLKYPHRFNWAAINNFAAAQATGDYLLFMNNDMEVIDADWIEALLEHAQRREVGVVGSKLLYPNNAVQHAGVLMGVAGVANHAFRNLPDDAPGYFGMAVVTRNYSAVTGACMMVRRAVFEEAGGFDEQLRVAFNDVDFCLRLRRRGYFIVYVPHARLYHFESATRGAEHPPEDDQYMRDRWEQLIRQGDPYYNPNLTAQREDFSLRV